MQINPTIFREYDIRGYVDVDLSEEFAYLLGRAYGVLARENAKDSIAIGFDARPSSEPYAQQLAKGMSDEGISSTLIGLGPTPQAYWAVFKEGYGGCIQVTGSHNPSDMNGFKICLGKNTLSGAEIQKLLTLMLAAQEGTPTAQEKGQIASQDLRQAYITDLVQHCKSHMGSRKIKVVVDAGNGVAGLIGPEVLRQLGVEVIELYCEPDGSFPNHHPDPTVLENLQDLIAKVKETGADLGIGWDGDGDRIGVVDENGAVIFGDMLVLLYARSILKEVPNATIIGDVKCSSQLFEDVTKRGGTAIMWKTGHSLMKNKLKETQAELAGEMSGHIFFNHRFYGFDDASYCSARLVEILSNCDEPLSSLLSDLPTLVSTPEIRVDCPEEIKFKIPELAKNAFPEFDVDTTDGARITFENGWGLVRASNTQSILVLRFEASDAASLARYQELVQEKIEDIKASLSA